MQCNIIISLRNEVIEQEISPKWSLTNFMKSDKISVSQLLRLFSLFRKDQQGASFGLTSPPRIGLKGTDELCMTKDG